MCIVFWAILLIMPGLSLLVSSSASFLPQRVRGFLGFGGNWRSEWSVLYGFVAATKTNEETVVSCGTVPIPSKGGKPFVRNPRSIFWVRHQGPLHCPVLSDKLPKAAPHAQLYVHAQEPSALSPHSQQNCGCPAGSVGLECLPSYP